MFASNHMWHIDKSSAIYYNKLSSELYNLVPIILKIYIHQELQLCKEHVTVTSLLQFTAITYRSHKYTIFQLFKVHFKFLAIS